MRLKVKTWQDLGLKVKLQTHHLHNTLVTRILKRLDVTLLWVGLLGLTVGTELSHRSGVFFPIVATAHDQKQWCQ